MARRLVKDVYSKSRPGKNFCKDYSFCNQIQRAALSVMNNIAEGFERGTQPDYARFLNMAKGSCGEVRSMTYVADDLDYLSRDQARDLRQKAFALSKSLAVLIKKVKTSSTATAPPWTEASPQGLKVEGSTH